MPASGSSADPLHRVWRKPTQSVRSRRSVILGYHGVGQIARRHDLSRLLVNPARFRAQVELLIEAGFRFVTVAELARLAATGAPPPGYVAISFDDGMRNNYTIALPILRGYRIPATVYVTIGFIGAWSPWIAAGKEEGRMLSEHELRELVGAGWELGAHTMTHPDLARLDYDGCRREIGESRAALEAITGVPVETFAYPFGRYGPAAQAAVRDSGLLAAVGTGRGSWSAYELRRAMISAGDPFAVMLLKMTDRYEPLLAPAPLRAARSASRRLRGRHQALRGHS